MRGVESCFLNSIVTPRKAVGNRRPRALSAGSKSPAVRSRLACCSNEFLIPTLRLIRRIGFMATGSGPIVDHHPRSHEPGSFDSFLFLLQAMGLVRWQPGMRGNVWTCNIVKSSGTFPMARWRCVPTCVLSWLAVRGRNSERNLLELWLFRLQDRLLEVGMYPSSISQVSDCYIFPIGYIRWAIGLIAPDGTRRRMEKARRRIGGFTLGGGKRMLETRLKFIISTAGTRGQRSLPRRRPASL